MRIQPSLLETLTVSFALFFLGRFVETHLVQTRWRLVGLVAGFLLSLPGLLFVIYYFHVFDNAAWFYNFWAIPGTEVLGAGLGFMTGWMTSKLRGEPLIERLAIPVVAFSLTLIPFIKPLLDPLDLKALSTHCSGEVCMQSTPSTCGPASAATLLSHFGKSSSEREIAFESLTYRGGTENWYLARTLRRHGLDVTVSVRSLEEPLPVPSIAGVKLSGGAGHFIAILGQTADAVSIGDPLKGKIVLDKVAAKYVYHFTGFFMIVHPAANASRD